jgi:hypothetical protein
MLKNPEKLGLKSPGFCIFQPRIDADKFPAHNRRMAKKTDRQLLLPLRLARQPLRQGHANFRRK